MRCFQRERCDGSGPKSGRCGILPQWRTRNLRRLHVSLSGWRHFGPRRLHHVNKNCAKIAPKNR